MATVSKISIYNQNPASSRDFDLIEMEVPKKADAQVVVVVVVRMIVVDVPAPGVEVAHVDAVAVGI